jgi:two-component system cell cycle sensor histidine kinase/response regulator CckA
LVIEVRQADGPLLRILQVEDSSEDAELVVRALRLGGLNCFHERVDTRASWERAIVAPAAWDLVLLDYSLPQLDTLDLLAELREREPDLPAIVVSGTITEDLAVSALRGGARDFVTKTNLARLVPAVLREVAAASAVRERHVAEAARDESEARFARFVENAQDIVVRCRVAPLGFEYVSPAVTSILGYAPAEFYADPELGERMIHPDDRQAVESAYAADPERPVTCRAIGADGRVVWLDRRQVAIRDDNGAVVALEAVIRDVTQQVLANEQLQGKERKFRAIFTGALDAMLLADDERVCLDANPAACELLGLPLDAIVGRRLEDFGVAGSVADLVSGWRTLLDAGRLEGRLTVVRPDGERRFAEFRATADVEPGIHLSIMRDVSERYEAEAALEATDARIAAMLAHLPLVVFSVPIVQESAPAYVSPRAEEIFGLPVDAWNQSPELFWNAVHPDDVEALREAQQLDDSANDFRLRLPDGQYVWVHGQNRFLRDADGTPTHLQGFLTDITELMASREALRVSEDRLRQAQKMEAVGQLAGGIAHDFNNLLTVINGYGDMALNRCNGDEDMRHSITEIRRAGDRAAELTQQLLAFSRQQVLKPEILDLNQVISDHASMLARLLGEDIDLQVVLNAEDGFIEADAGQLAQVILNLAANARDAMPEGGELLIRTDSLRLTGDEVTLGVPAGAYVALEVRDTGTGVDAATLTHVFEPFYTTKEVGKGTGLGLSTVLGIVEQSRGRIVVDSEPGEGTTFHIYLPQVETPAGGAEKRLVRRDEYRGTENVLLVEDDSSVRGLIEAILVDRGYNVLSTDSPLSALATSAGYAGEIHLVVTDVVMPEMNGRQLAEQIEVQRPNIRTLYISGYTSDAIMARGVLPAGMHFLQKPFTASQLAAKARDALVPPAGQEPPGIPGAMHAAP